MRTPSIPNGVTEDPVYSHSGAIGALVQIRRCVGRWTPAPRKLFTWATPVIAMLKELAPYAAIELLLPGGSLMALTLWFYRRRNRVPALAKSLNTLL
jgi:hypothetical protein